MTRNDASEPSASALTFTSFTFTESPENVMSHNNESNVDAYGQKEESKYSMCYVCGKRLNKNACSMNIPFISFYFFFFSGHDYANESLA